MVLVVHRPLHNIEASSLEHKQCYNIVGGKEKYIYVLQVHRNILLRVEIYCFVDLKYNLFMAFNSYARKPKHSNN